MKPTSYLVALIASSAVPAWPAALEAGTIVAKPPVPCPGSIGHADFHEPVLAIDFEGENQSVAVADLDDDGHADIVLSDTSGDRIRIGFGKGDGTFGSFKTFAMGDGPTEVKVADFNADGYSDIIATNFEQDRVYIRWGAALSPWTQASVWTVGDLPLDVAVGDLNDDGLVDFAAVNGFDDTITVRLRKPDTGFALGDDYPCGDPAHDLVLADADGDGDLDLVYCTGLHENAKLAVRKNDGHGKFGAPALSSMKSAHGEFFQALTVADLDEDGKLDVVLAKNTHSLVRALGNGSGTFGSVVEAPTENNPSSLVTADFNLDGHKDLAVAHFYNSKGVSIYLGHGDGNMVGPLDLGVEFSIDKAFCVETGDFNEDGFPDVVYSGYYGAHVLLSKPRCEEEVEPRERFIRGDANGDRAVDIGDAVSMLGCLFLGTKCSRCPDAADVNDDGELSIGDPVYLLTYLFSTGKPPVGSTGACGYDSTKDDLGECVYDACDVKR